MESQQEQCTLLTKLPREVRDRIYEQYIFDHLQNTRLSTSPPNRKWERSYDCIPGDKVLFEAADEDNPSFVRTCKKVARELGLIASQHVYFRFGDLGPGMEYRHADLSLPCRIPDPACLRHLHLEWRYCLRPHDRMMMKMAGEFELIHRVVGDMDFSNLETIRLHPRFQLDLPIVRVAFSSHYQAVPSAFRIFESAMEALLNRIQVLYPALKAVELVGFYRSAWLDHLRAGYKIKIHRGLECRVEQFGIADTKRVDGLEFFPA
ncbi:hypothetical protein MN608_09176 [Microdochium nivale]|nr:hypothetical protein MN608_09176 [Microdochium nivale]